MWPSRVRDLRWLLVRIKYLPPEAALWGHVRKEKGAGAEPHDRGNVVSIAEFVAANTEHLRGGEDG